MKKTRNQKIRDISEGLLKIFFASWPFNQLPDDYGLDFFITVTEDEVVSEYNFLVQLKGSESIDYKNDFLNFDMETKHLQSYIKIPIPILLIIYDINTKNAYWINIQKYCRNVLNVEDPNWHNQGQKRIKIPLSNQLNDLDVIKNEIIQSSKENMRIYVENMKWPEGYESILNDSEKIKEVINKTNIENIKRRIHTSILYFRSDNIEEMQEQFFEIYKLKRKDRHHLQAILAIMTSSNIFTEKIETFIDLTKEGIQLSKELQDQLYLNIFTFFIHYYTTFDILVKQQIPNILKRMEASKRPENINDFIKFIWESENIVLNGIIKENSKKMLELLNQFLESNNLFEFHILNLHLLQIEVFLNSILKEHIEQSVFSKILEKNEQFIELLVELSEKFRDTDTQLHTYLLAGGYYEAYKLEKAKELYRKGLKLAKESNHHYYIKKFNLNLVDLGSKSKLYTIDDIIKISLSKTIETLKTFKFSNLNSINDPHIRASLKLALNDLNPIDILKKCINIIVGYYPSILGQAQGIYSLGIKRIACAQNKQIYESANLRNIYHLFENNFCNNCKERTPRGDDYDPPTSIISEMALKINHIEQIRSKNP